MEIRKRVGVQMQSVEEMTGLIDGMGEEGIGLECREEGRSGIECG